MRNPLSLCLTCCICRHGPAIQFDNGKRQISIVFSHLQTFQKSCSFAAPQLYCQCWSLKQKASPPTKPTYVVKKWLNPFLVSEKAVKKYTKNEISIILYLNLFISAMLQRQISVTCLIVRAFSHLSFPTFSQINLITKGFQLLYLVTVFCFLTIPGKGWMWSL